MPSSRRLLALVPGLLLVSVTAAQTPHRGIDPANLDTTCAPCTDFFQYADGGWLKTHTIPPQYSTYGSFTELTERNEATLRTILERLASTAPANPKTTDEKLGAFYASCMDSAQSEAAGAKPLQQTLADIAAVSTTDQLVTEVARLHKEGRGGLFGFGGGADFKNSAMTIAQVSQGGLGLPNRDYYTRTDSATAAIRAAYVAHVSRTLQLLGDAPAAADSAAAHVMAIENALALASLSPVQRRDPNANYHKMPFADAQALAPHLSWHAFFLASGVPVPDSINVGQPGFFQSLDSLLTRFPIGDWKNYLRWHVANGAAPWLSSGFVNEQFSFQQTLSGVKEQQPRWRRCLNASDRMMSDALGAAYVKETFTPAARARALAMVDNLIAALDDRLHTLEWMSDTTRQRALVKLRAIKKKIGYPDKWRDYAALAVDKGPFALNVSRAEAFGTAYNYSHIGKPVDPTEWGMTPPTVNAQYNPTRNDITFPAGILQPPFFDPAADDAVNYGGMGAVIGHEMTHGFDDQGRQFDAAGNLRDWWTPDDATRFKARAQRVVDEFDGFTVVDSTVHVNGRLTLGENIADLGGLKIAYAAFQRSLAGKQRPDKIDGFTPEQRFFLAWAQIWRRMSRPEALRLQVNTDPHAPAQWRVNGPLANLAEFAQAFGCHAGDKMVRPDSLRATIW